MLIDKPGSDRSEIHRVLEKYGTHSPALIHNRLARRPRFHLHFRPTSESWINQVRHRFARIARLQILPGMCCITSALETASKEYLAVYNEEPNLFTWHNTADEILESLMRHFERNSNRGR